jgi:hypothetical protein
MTQKDFGTLEAMCHLQAFGSDREYINGEQLFPYGFKGHAESPYVVLWKIPADLKSIAGYVQDQSKRYTENDAGNYALSVYDFKLKCANEKKIILQQLDGFYGTKIRTDFPGDPQPPSTHHLVIEKNGNTLSIPALSSSYVFQDFDDSQDNENTKVDALFQALDTLGIGAYSENNTHHLIVFGAHEGKELTPQAFAELLSSTPAIVEAIKEAAWSDAKKAEVELWKNSFISRFKTA